MLCMSNSNSFWGDARNPKARYCAYVWSTVFTSESGETSCNCPPGTGASVRPASSSGSSGDGGQAASSGSDDGEGDGGAETENRSDGINDEQERRDQLLILLGICALIGLAGLGCTVAVYSLNWDGGSANGNTELARYIDQLERKEKRETKRLWKEKQMLDQAAKQGFNMAGGLGNSNNAMYKFGIGGEPVKRAPWAPRRKNNADPDDVLSKSGIPIPAGGFVATGGSSGLQQVYPKGAGTTGAGTGYSTKVGLGGGGVGGSGRGMGAAVAKAEANKMRDYERREKQHQRVFEQKVAAGTQSIDAAM